MAIVSNLTTSLISGLGNNGSSLLPIMAKDLTQDTATTLVYHAKGGKHDGRERAIEEYGTGLIWIAGIPTLKKVFDKTVYKAVKINPDVDIRKFKDTNADNLKYAVDKLANASDKYCDKAQKAILENTIKNKKFAKNLYIGKFLFSTLATMASLGALIKLKQKTTEKEIKKSFAEKMILEEGIKKSESENQVFSAFMGSKKQNNPSFKGIGSFMSGFMYNPVMNMSILDATISGTRLAEARKGERGEVFFKEASVVAFLYVLAKPIQKGFEALSKKLFNKPIELDYKVLANDEFLKSLKDGSLQKSLEEFDKVIDRTPAPKTSWTERLKGLFNEAPMSPQDKKILDFIWDNPDNAIVKALKISGEVPTLKDSEKFLKFFKLPVPTEKIDALAYMDTDAIKEAVDNLDGFMKKADLNNIDLFIKKTKGLKTAATLLNIGVSVAFLGIIQPLLAIARRKIKNGGDNENPAIKEVQANYAQQMSLK